MKLTAGVQLEADVMGAGPPVVLLHGGGQTRHAWSGTARALADKGFTAYSVDLRGHGDSEWPANGDYSLDAFAHDVSLVCQQLGKPMLIGASLGGAAALLASAHARALVMVDVAPRIEDKGVDRITRFMRAHSETGFASLEEAADAVHAYNPRRARNVDGLRKNLRDRDGRWYWHWDPRFMFAASDETRITIDPDRMERAARAVTIPTLLVRGRESDLLSEDGAKKFLALVPHALYADVQGAGHMIAGDKNDVFNAAVLQFLVGLL